jgi:hypothetical protein
MRRNQRQTSGRLTILRANGGGRPHRVRLDGGASGWFQLPAGEAVRRAPSVQGNGRACCIGR